MSAGRRPPVRQLVGIPLNTLLFLLLMVVSWGSWRGFFEHPVRGGVVLLFLLMIPVMTLNTSGRSRGVRWVRDGRAFFPLLVFHSLLAATALPYMDARELWVLPGGDALRWMGLATLAAGVGLRLVAMLELGHRFASVVAIQSDHTLNTGGLYRWIRHPSYLGILLMDLGLAGAFRSSVSLALMPIVLWMFVRRMDVEEGLLMDQFGDDYRTYMARTARLLPGFY